MSMSQVEQELHGALPKPTHDELARQQFVRTFKEHIMSDIFPGNRVAYERRAKPAFENSHGVEPKDMRDVAKVMNNDPHFKMFSALLRTSQEMMWSSVQLPVQRTLAELNKTASSIKAPLGTLTLDSSVVVPDYHTAVDIHCQPGGYHTEYIADDVAQGAIYDRAVYLYAMGQLGCDNADIGDSLVSWLESKAPDMSPIRILDMGCSVGHSTLPYGKAWPAAELHAIDVAAPMLRYAHARAEAKGVKVHFSQQNAEKTKFDDGSFDIIVSHILLHETSEKAIRNIVAECYRLLKPGGIMIHAETPPYEGMEPFEVFLFDWDTVNNNEPFWRRSHQIDLIKLSDNAGFDSERNITEMVPSAYQMAAAERTNAFQAGDFGGGGAWFIYGCYK